MAHREIASEASKYFPPGVIARSRTASFSRRCTGRRRMRRRPSSGSPRRLRVPVSAGCWSGFGTFTVFAGRWPMREIDVRQPEGRPDAIARGGGIDLLPTWPADADHGTEVVARWSCSGRPRIHAHGISATVPDPVPDLERPRSRTTLPAPQSAEPAGFVDARVEAIESWRSRWPSGSTKLGPPETSSPEISRQHRRPCRGSAGGLGCFGRIGARLPQS